eukprot:m.8554 g.8554  ORF g.8554 m.8554 type:complete len:54 (+) comp5472_c0_seq1:935-1096(+)
MATMKACGMRTAQTAHATRSNQNGIQRNVINSRIASHYTVRQDEGSVPHAHFA